MRRRIFIVDNTFMNSVIIMEDYYKLYWIK